MEDAPAAASEASVRRSVSLIHTLYIYVFLPRTRSLCLKWWI